MAVDPVLLLVTLYASGLVSGAAAVVLGSWAADRWAYARARRSVPESRKRAL